MPNLNLTLAGLFIALAAVFAMAIHPSIARRFYPGGTLPMGARIAVPAIFLTIAAACCTAPLAALCLTALGGSALIMAGRRASRRRQLAPPMRQR